MEAAQQEAVANALEQSGNNALSILNPNDDVLFLFCETLQRTFQDVHHDGTPRPSERDEANPSTPLKFFSATCSRLRTVSYSLVFRGIRTGYTWDWPRIRTSLQQIRSCPAAAQHTQHFFMHVHAGSQKDTPPPDGRIAMTLAETLKGLPKVHDLTLKPMPEFGTLFQKAFTYSNARFGDVATLRVGSQMGWLMAQCPSLTAFQHSSVAFASIDSALALLDDPVLAPSFKKLQHFELRTHWTPQLLSKVVAQMPKLQSLGVTGDMGSDRHCLDQLIPLLGRFKHLEIIRLPGLHDLGVGYQGRPVNNARQRRRTAEFNERLEKQAKDLQESITKDVAQACASIRELWIEDTQMVVHRLENGGIYDVYARPGRKVEWPPKLLPESEGFARIPA